MTILVGATRSALATLSVAFGGAGRGAGMRSQPITPVIERVIRHVLAAGAATSGATELLAESTRDVTRRGAMGWDGLWKDAALPCLGPPRCLAGGARPRQGTALKWLSTFPE